AKFVEMANFAQMVNTLGAIITYDHKIIVNPHYYALKIFSDSWPSEAHLLNLEVECKDIISEDFANIPIIKRPILDTSALISKDGKQLALFIINKHFTESIKIDIKIDSGLNFSPKKEVHCKLLTHNNPFAINTRENPDEIKIAEFILNYNDGLSYKSPAHSLTALIFNSI
ncbi:MAG: alpha-L-arabinofuranosidase C-terminal domain-containing protein, partial [Candidatus Helarchaeota archaeon]